MSIIFLSFGGGGKNYHDAVERICEQAKNFNLFEKIYKFTEKDLQGDNDFWSTHSKFITENPKGYGYWLWKPYLIKKVLSETKDEDVVFYLDAGCELNIQAKEKLLEYIAQTRKNGYLAFEILHIEKKWTKADLFKRLNCDEKIMNSKQIEAGVQFIKNCPENREFVEKWYNIVCEENYRYIDNTASKIKNCSQFIQHRNDQSCFSCLFKMSRKFFLPNQYYKIKNNQQELLKYPIWILRNRTGNSMVQISQVQKTPIVQKRISQIQKTPIVQKRISQVQKTPIVRIIKKKKV